MSLIPSNLKTWLRRNGFKCEERKPMRECNGYVERSGRKFRIRMKEYSVDIGEPHKTFDRWANSTERTVTINGFIREFSRTKQ